MPSLIKELNQQENKVKSGAMLVGSYYNFVRLLFLHFVSCDIFGLSQGFAVYDYCIFKKLCTFLACLPLCMFCVIVLYLIFIHKPILRGTL